MVQNKVDRLTIDIYSKFDIPNTIILSSTCGFIFSYVAFASCIVSFVRW